MADDDADSQKARVLRPLQAAPPAACETVCQHPHPARLS